MEMMIFPSSKVEMITEATLDLLLLSHKHTDPDDGRPTGSMEKVGYVMCCTVYIFIFPVPSNVKDRNGGNVILY